MKITGVIAFVLLFALLLCACEKDPGATAVSDPGSVSSAAESREEPGDVSGEESGSEPAKSDANLDESGFADSPSELFSGKDYKTEFDASECVKIVFENGKVTTDSSSVRIDGTTATVKEDGTYLVSGSCEDGMLIVNAEDEKPRIILNGLTLTSKTSAALYVKQADKVFVTVAEGTENVLANGGTFTSIDSNNIDGAVFSKDDLTFNGDGKLTVSSEGGHGVVCKDDLVFAGGIVTVSAAGHGIDANDSLRFVQAELTVTAGKDGIHVDNDEDETKGFVYIGSGKITADVRGDAISASSYAHIKEGVLNLTANNKSSDESVKGIKAADILIEGGTFAIDTSDDALHSKGRLIVKGGEMTVKTGDDAFHADDTLHIRAGRILITESYEGLEAQYVVISGGELTLTATDDGINAAGGNDGSGEGGPRGGDSFGRPGGPGGQGGPGGPGGPGGKPGQQPGGSSDGEVRISGGTIRVVSSGDGIDANGILEITGGDIMVTGPSIGDTATLDFDISGTISGGRFVGTGASGMAQTFSPSSQGVLAISAGNRKAGTSIVVKDESGNVLLEHAPEMDFQVLIFSDPALKKGEKYTVTIGSDTKTFEAD